MEPVRLDVVAKLKEREEERRLGVLAGALSAAREAAEALAQAEAQARREHDPKGTAAQLLLEDAAQARSVVVRERAREAAAKSASVAQDARAAWNEARRSAEVVRRLAEVRRDELVAAREKKEQRALDELTLLRFSRSAG
ncbi:MAG: hypothetical protein K1X89_11635 [Myxococcaceae bacterium]|nr:hypothetical protein [Myxococcaceae bacterium]